MARVAFSEHEFRVEKAKTMVGIGVLALALLLKNAK